jgi:DNA-directed RNA polymerase subunit RPC12/RpoP
MRLDPDPHGAHLLAPIVPEITGTRTAACPVCSHGTVLPASGGWVPVRCPACGTDFVATDGSRPPEPPPPPPPPAPSPIAPHEPLEPLPAHPDRPRGFTSDVRPAPDGGWRVTCPQCGRADLEVPDSATVAVVLRCPVCHGPFLVGLGGSAPAPPGPPARARLFSHSRTLLPHYADGRWYACPVCARVFVLIFDSDPDATTITCPSCVHTYTIGSLRRPPPPPPPPRGLWRRVRDWLKG